MSDPKRLSEGRKRRARVPYVAFVEGLEYGVPYRVFFKRMDCALRLTRDSPGAVCVDLATLLSHRYVGGDWHITT